MRMHTMAWPSHVVLNMAPFQLQLHLLLLCWLCLWRQLFWKSLLTHWYMLAGCYVGGCSKLQVQQLLKLQLLRTASGCSVWSWSFAQMLECYNLLLLYAAVCTFCV